MSEIELLKKISDHVAAIKSGIFVISSMVGALLGIALARISR